jgi:hypothetical protein
MCTNCSLPTPGIPAATRQWRCQRCGTLHDRDELSRSERSDIDVTGLLKALGIE